MWYQMLFIYLLFISKLSTAQDDADGTYGVVVGNLRRRESIPLYKLGRRHVYPGEDLNYRKTKDIRYDREVDNQQIMRASEIGENKEPLDKLHRELRWLTIDTDQGLKIGI